MLNSQRGTLFDKALVFLNIYYIVFDQKCSIVLISPEDNSMEDVLIQLPSGNLWSILHTEVVREADILHIYAFDDVLYKQQVRGSCIQ